jgi:hypothetical protein
VALLTLDDKSSRPRTLVPIMSKQRQQLERAEYEFDPSLMNLMRPTVASIVQRAPMLQRASSVGRPIPVFKSDCAVADLGEYESRIRFMSI